MWKSRRLTTVENSRDFHRVRVICRFRLEVQKEHQYTEFCKLDYHRVRFELGSHRIQKRRYNKYVKLHYCVRILSVPHVISNGVRAEDSANA
jgi:hypothetical protein